MGAIKRLFRRGIILGVTRKRERDGGKIDKLPVYHENYTMVWLVASGGKGAR